MTGIRILCVDPDAGERTTTVEGLRSALDDPEAAFLTAGSLDEARDRLAAGAPVDCVVTEYDLPDGTGLELVAAVRSVAPDAGCILFTGTDHEAIDTASFGGAVVEYLRKDATHAVDRLADVVRSTAAGRSQASYPLPQDESERIAALRAYDLDSAELRESLDRVIDLAGRHFDVHSASINVIDEHSEEFLVCHAAASSWEPVAREESICTFTILEEESMVVEDVQADPRFEATEALPELGIRSYMGANLITPAGLVIGTLCVYDDEPRSFSAADEAYLRDLAAVAMDLIGYYHRATGRPDERVAAGAGDGRDDENGDDGRPRAGAEGGDR